MKTKFLSTIFAFAAMCGAVAFTSCGGNDGPVEPPVPSDGLVLRASRTTAVAGEQSVKFSVMNDGSMVTSKATIKNVTTGADVQNGVWMPEAKGVNAFVATYNGATSKEVSVDVKAAGTTFYQHVVMAKGTATWCNPCHAAQPTLDKYVETNPGRLLIYALHTNDSFACADGEDLLSKLGVSGIPTWYFNYNGSPLTGADCKNASTLRSKISTVMSNYPVACGVKAASTVSGSTASVKATVKFLEAGNYKIACCLTENGLRYDAKTYDHVLRKFQTNLEGDAVTPVVAAGDEREFNFNVTLNGSWKTDALEFIIYVYQDMGSGAFIVNNGILCPLGQTVPYQHNPAE